MWPKTATPFGMLSEIPREKVENHGRACTHVLFLRKAELEFFHCLEIMTGWPVPSDGQKIPVKRGWYLSPQKIPLAENRFLQTGNGAGFIWFPV
jgi:hypothetical protein